MIEYEIQVCIFNDVIAIRIKNFYRNVVEQRIALTAIGDAIIPSFQLSFDLGF